MLQVTGLEVHRQRVPVLVGVDLEVRAGEVVALVGANGSGRTSLLLAVSGLLRPVRGQVLLDGRPLTGLRPDRVVAAGVGHVPQGRRVFARLTVRENLLVGGHLLLRRGRGTRAYEAAVERVLGLFPVLAERADSPAGTLSGGEQQQLAVGRALVARPRLLLLDEPTTGLAPTTAAALLDAVRRVAEEGTAVLLVDQAEPALRTADRGVVLETGRVVLTGPAADLLADPGLRAAHLGG